MYIYIYTPYIMCLYTIYVIHSYINIYDNYTYLYTHIRDNPRSCLGYDSQSASDVRI